MRVRPFALGFLLLFLAGIWLGQQRTRDGASNKEQDAWKTERRPEEWYRSTRHARSALWVRTYAGNEELVTKVLLTSLRFFWPPRRFGRVFVVLDGGEADYAMATRLLERFGGEELRADDVGDLYVYRAMLPKQQFVASGGTGRSLSSSSYFPAQVSQFGSRVAQHLPHHLNDPLLTITYARSPVIPDLTGYEKQLWDTFYADRDVPEQWSLRSPIDSGHGDPEPPNDLIGIVDSDSLIFSLPHDRSYFDEAGRPIVQPRVGLPFGDLWIEAAQATEWMLGVPEPARAMSYFPVYIKRAHFKALRDHVERLFSEPFPRVFAYLQGRSLYSQFNILVAYIYHFHRDEYAWRWFLPDSARGERFDPIAMEGHNITGFTHDFSFLDNADETVHWARTWTHWRHHLHKDRIRNHLTRGFCWGVSGIESHPLCGDPRNGWWNSTSATVPLGDRLDISSTHFEYVGRLGEGAVDAWRSHVRSVGRDISRGAWDAGAMAQWLQAFDTPDPEEKPKPEERRLTGAGDNRPHRRPAGCRLGGTGPMYSRNLSDSAPSSPCVRAENGVASHGQIGGAHGRMRRLRLTQ